MTSNYRVGTGIFEITDPAIGLPMQGFADDRQKTGGVESPLFSRAFIIEDQQTEKRVVIVCAEIWAGTSVVKEEVVKRLKDQFKTLYTSNNVLISGTHTHSAPGGYAGYILYDLTGKGFDQNTFECIVSGMVTSIQKAHHSLGSGKIYVSKGKIAGCGQNRSLGAYLNNPQSERDTYSDTDKEMLLLKFTKLDSSGREYPIGVLNWFAIHPTDRDQKNRLVCGDSKGYASALFEAGMQTDPFATETFVAAFANSSAGDVSGNLEFGPVPNGDGIAHMQKHARQQYEKAKELFDSASEELSGSVDYRHTRVDMSSVVIENIQGARTWPAALGLSFAAGSSEDSVPNPPAGLKEGITVTNISPSEVAMLGLASWAGKIAEDIPLGVEFLGEIAAGHFPKPILFAVGAREGLSPKILPLQILRIGQLVLTAVPAEFTTMAGRRLRQTVLNELTSMGVRHLAIAGYANDYSQYVTTKEEYDMQHYEGASNLFGPFTLHAYQQEFRKLAIALQAGNQVEAGPLPPRKSSQPARRWTFRNLSNSNIELKFYNTDDSLKSMTLPNGTKTIPAHREVAFPEKEFTGALLPAVAVARVIFSGAQEKTVAVDNLVTITEAGGIEIAAYRPPTRTKPQALFISVNAQGVPAAKGDPWIIEFASVFLHLVYRDANDQIANIAWIGSSWAYTNLSSVTGAPKVKGDPRIVQFASGFLHLVYRDVNDQIANIAWNGASWVYGNLSQLATGAPAAKGDPCIIQFASGFLHLVYRDLNDQIANIAWNGARWVYGNLSQLATGAPAAKGDPCIVQFASGFLHLVYRDVNDQIANIAWIGSRWVYANLSSATGAPKVNGDPCIVQFASGFLHLVYRDVKDQIADIAWNGASWAYANLSQLAIVALAAKGDPCIVQYASGFLELVYRDVNDQIANLAWNGSIWVYNNLSLATGAPPAKGDPCIVEFASGFLHLVYRNANDQITDLSWNGSRWVCQIFGTVVGR